MSAPVAFYFDFGSPYAYCAAALAEAIAEKHGRVLDWRPVLLWVCRKAFGMAAPLQDGPKADYMPLDFERSAAFHRLPFTLPPSFAKSTHAAARLFYGIADTDPARATAFARRALTAHFAEGTDLTDMGVLAAFAAEAGIATEDAVQLAGSERARARLQQVNDDAIAAGIWGSPFFVLDGEPFFGADRLPHLEWRLSQGPARGKDTG